MVNDCNRPWGFYENLVEKDDHKIKRITVAPGKRLSLQRHQRRAEHWYVISGEALVEIDKDKYKLQKGDSVDIAREAVHRIENTGESDLIFIEIQTGDYFGEDDIERLEDDYGRE